MPGDLFPTATPWEWAWASVGGLCLFLNICFIVGAAQRIISLQMVGRNGPLRIVSWGNLRRELVRCSGHVAVFAMGVDSALNPTPARDWRSAAHVVISLAFWLNSILDQLDRWLIDRYLSKQHQSEAKQL